jgi:FtsH-binding integral membrane protein
MALMEQHNSQALAEEQARFMTKVYLWMSFGLATTAYTAYITANSPALLGLVMGSKLGFYGLLILEFGLVFAISALIRKISAMVATGLFFLYALANGLTFSVIFLAYTQQSIVSAFGITAGMFAGLSAFGFITKRDLSALGAFMISALFGLVLGMVVNLFLHNGLLDWVLSMSAVVIFSGLIAYDTQKIKSYNTPGSLGTEDSGKNAIYGALVLYLDFINLFLNMLRLMGGRRR